jgi:hypothetical protein
MTVWLPIIIVGFFIFFVIPIIRNNADRQKKIALGHKIESDFRDTVQELVNYLFSNYYDIIYKKFFNTRVIKFESAVFLLFRIDYFIVQNRIKDQEFREIVNMSIDNYFKSEGLFNASGIDGRMKIYASRVGNPQGGNFFDVMFSKYIYFWGLINRAIEINNWFKFLEISPDETLPPSGILSTGLTFDIEENIVIPIYKKIQCYLENNLKGDINKLNNKDFKTDVFIIIACFLLGVPLAIYLTRNLYGDSILELLFIALLVLGMPLLLFLIVRYMRKGSVIVRKEINRQIEKREMIDDALTVWKKIKTAASEQINETAENKLPETKDNQPETGKSIFDYDEKNWKDYPG